MLLSYPFKRQSHKMVKHTRSYMRATVALNGLIMAKFILFMIVPNVLRLLVSLKFFHPVLGYKIPFVLIPIGFMADPVIYVFSLKTSCSI